ncbi:MAG: OmpA family protein [Desulfobulbaceae bacterium]|nr:OmpA family protein [Desulfobulbaceae bacterium]
MNKKTFAGWMNFPAMLVVMAAFGCSLNRGDVFVKYNDIGVVTYRDSSAAPVHLDNSRADQVKYYNVHAKQVNYYKKGDLDPILLTPSQTEDDSLAERNEKLTPMEAEFKAAVTMEALGDFVNRYAPDELAFVAVQKIAQPFIDAKNWSEAGSVYSKYRNKFLAKDTAFNKISAILTAPSQGLVVNNLGPVVNSAEGEYAPVISSNGKKLLFARDCGTCGGGEEVYIANLNSAGSWGKVDKFGSPLSSRRNEIPLALSADDNALAVFGNYDGSLGRGDIFHVDKTADSWTSLQHYPTPLNSEYFDSNAMYSADGKAILFISERPGGVGEFHQKGSFFYGGYDGNTDIYVYIPDMSGGGQSINLGTVINTPYAEYSPFLHPDGKTMYFSSNGHPGLGGLDVFKSTRLNADSWTDWSEPENLGKEINTTYNDWGYQFPARGDIGYFSSGNRPDGYGGSDIFSVSLSGKAQPSAVITVGGTVTDPDGNFLLADIRWNDITRGKEVGHLTSNPQTGEYLVHLPVGGKYTFFAEKSGYMGESESLDLSDDLRYREFILDIVLHPIKNQTGFQPQKPVVAMINMNNIFFDFDKANLRSESSLELDRWIRMLRENPSVTIEVEGHTDSIGTAIYNQKLSEQRAQAVVEYLAMHGIDQERLEAKGFGEKLPLSNNKTSDGRQQNRRVEVKIFNNGSL